MSNYKYTITELDGAFFDQRDSIKEKDRKIKGTKKHGPTLAMSEVVENSCDMWHVYSTLHPIYLNMIAQTCTRSQARSWAHTHPLP